MELLARSSITINGAFEAKLGSEFEAGIDAGFVGVTSKFEDNGDRTAVVELNDEYVLRVDKGGSYDLVLEPNYPDPFNPVTQIQFAIPEATQVTVVVFNILGQEIARLIDGPVEAGTHTIHFDASGIASGTYVYRVQAGQHARVGTMTVIK